MKTQLPHLPYRAVKSGDIDSGNWHWAVRGAPTNTVGLGKHGAEIATINGHAAQFLGAEIAALFAAAPDLLEACETAEHNLAAAYSLDHIVIKRLRDAIAKARG